MFLVAIKKAEKDGFTLSVETDATVTNTTIESLPKWIYEEFTGMESLIKKYLKSVDCSLVGYRVKQSKEDTKAIFDITTRLGDVPARSRFSVDSFTFKPLNFDGMNDEDIKRFKEQQKLVNSMVERHKSFSELLQGEFAKLVMSQSGQLAIFE